MINLINRLFRLTWFPLAFQLLTLTVLIMLIVGGFLANTSDMAFAKVLRNTNIANLIVWSYWWPLIILSAIFLGRVWCTVCPMELVTSLASKVGLKRKPPAFIRSGWVMTGLYILILFVGIHMLSIHRIPFRMAIYMLVLFGAAVAFGLLFSRNTFCAHVCPVGHLLGLYSRLAPMGWGVRDKSVCSDCKDQLCVSNKTAYRFQGRSCGVGLRPAILDDNTECLVCGQCMKACDRNNPGLGGRPNPGWLQRRWFKDIIDLKVLTAAQSAFCLVVSGFVIYELFTEWSVSKELLLWAPSKLEQMLGVSGPLGHGMVKSLMLFAVLPALIWLVPFGAFRLTGGRLPLSNYLLRFGIAFIPIMAAAHAIKALLKMTSRIPYWEYVFSDPLGAETARCILDKTEPLASLPFWRDPAMTILALGLMGVAVTLSILVVRKLIAVHMSDRSLRSLSLYLIPILYGGAFSTMLIVWRLF
ncbi:MAG: 4Fe-4S binding protein [Desulfobacteraceae bacterium]|nr:4Fe-4S binding protein [Desulfobacteraceae bacterium]MBC2720833.1 4Fe-4S binding protein [Desulfobacteraceae bacterium]